MERRWKNFTFVVRYHAAFEEGMIFYKDTENNYQLILNSYPYMDRFEFMVKSILKVKRDSQRGAGDVSLVTIFRIPLYN